MMTHTTVDTSAPSPLAPAIKATLANVSDQPSWFQRMARRKLVGWLSELENGVIYFTDSTNEDSAYGNGSDDALQSHWRVLNPCLFSRLATDGSIGIAESYLRGEWTSNDLTSLLRILCRNLHRTQAADSGIASFALAIRRILNRLDGNTIAGSQRHIASHYDLSNEFFELFLDPSLMYSCAYFERPDSTLHEASRAKLAKICQKLKLQPADRVLEIGTGWGGFALHAVENHGCNLTTTTISAAQFRKAQERFAEARVEQQITLLDTDYRELTGQYDKIVSIEMVEAVGERYLDAYFRQCGRLLKPGGRFVMQAIVMPEQRYSAYRRSVDFIQQYIFPGGFLPSVSTMQESVSRESNLRLDSVEDLSPHYARTLEAWRHRFFASIDEVRRLGFDNRFIRMWEYYLCYCEAAFREQSVRVVQIAWDKPVY